jgi:RimJ/RimL family protein N-acetyltransferase
MPRKPRSVDEHTVRIARSRASSRRPRAVVRGERVYLGRPSPRDLEAWRALVRESWRFLSRWMVRPARGTRPDDPRLFASLLRANRGRHSVKLFVRRSSDGALLGVVNLNEIVLGAFQSAYLGYWIGSRHARQGYMHEALRLALRYAFGTLGLHRVEANVVPGNRASIALVRGAGFRREGLSKRYLRIAGRWQDHERWALLRDEFPRAGGRS